ncbi:MAG: TolC family protein [Treponema sp.]|nr:TolC family protein [Treponema sp.]
MKKLVAIFTTVLLAATVGAQENLTLTVEEAVDYAREHSRTIRSAAIDVESQSDARNHVLNVFLPNVSFSGTITKPNEYDTTYATLLNPLYEQTTGTRPLPTDFTSTGDEYTVVGTASISFTWALSIIENVKKANRDYEAGVISWEQTVKQNERDVKKLFYSMLLSQKTLENDKDSLENAFQRYTKTERSYRAGSSPRLDVLQSHVTYENMKIDVEKEEAAFNQQMKQFAYILGLPPSTKITLSGTLDTVIDEFDREAMMEAYSAYNSEIRLLETKIKSVSAQMRGLNLDSFTPKLSFSYATNQTLHPIDSDWLDGSNWSDKGSASMSLTWSFTDALPFSNNRIKYNNLRREREQLELSLEQTKDKITLDTEKLFDDLEAAAARIKASKENIALAEESYTLLSNAYNNGTVDFIEVKEAETQLNKARLAEQSELYTYISSLTELEYILDLPANWRNL